MTDNLFESAYQRLAVVDHDRPCHGQGCATPATTEERRYFLSRTCVARDGERVLLYCPTHAHDARIEYREAGAILAERSQDRTTGYWVGYQQQLGFKPDFDATACFDAEQVERWQEFLDRLDASVDWLPEPCFHEDCPRDATTQAPQVCVDLEYEYWDRVDRWFCGRHAANASRHADEAEAALNHLREVCAAEPDDHQLDAANRACSAVLERTRSRAGI
jgi:hypothetical protein